MVKEKDFLGILLFLGFTLSTAEASTVCTVYEGKRICGNSLVLETKGKEFSACLKSTDNCKKLVVTNSHLTSGSKIEICDDNQKCQTIDKKNVLNDVINDVAVFQLDKSSTVSTNGTVVRLQSGPIVIYSYQKTVDTGIADVFSDKTLSVSGNSSEGSLITPNWTKPREGERGTRWEDGSSGLLNYVVVKGMSGSPLLETSMTLDQGTISRVKGIVTGHHNYLPLSHYTTLDSIQNVGDEYFNGRRGLTAKSEERKARWHYSLNGGTTYRSLYDGDFIETGILTTPTGGGSSTDTGGGSSTDTGGGSSTDTGGGSSTDTGGGSSTDTGGGSSTDTGGGSSTDTGFYCEIPSLLDTKDFQKFNQFYGLYHGVIIKNKQVIGFLDKETGRIIHATWDLLNDEEILKAKSARFVPYLEDKFSAKDLLFKNHPDLKNGKEVFCFEESNDCIELQVEGNKLVVTSVGTDQKETIELAGISSRHIFRNLPVKYASGRKSAIWLADIFLPDMKFDSLRDSKNSIVGGEHSNMKLEVLKKRSN